MKVLKMLDKIAQILLIIAGICWGLAGAFNYQIVSVIFGNNVDLTRIVYVAFGIAAIFKIIK